MLSLGPFAKFVIKRTVHVGLDRPHPYHEFVLGHMPCKKIAEGVEAGALFECEDRAVRYGAPPANCKIVACEGC
jgi:hypothetical protein